ncbi:hypothetical protein N7465_002133, partial [Penicillium sp. CMV-2018d]
RSNPNIWEPKYQKVPWQETSQKLVWIMHDSGPDARYNAVARLHDNHEIFPAIASYEPEYVECFEANLSNPRAVIIEKATTYYKSEAIG